MTTNYRTVPLSQVRDLDPSTLINLVDAAVKIDITQEGETGTLIGTLRLLTVLDDGVVLGLQDAAEPLGFAPSELDDVTVTFYEFGAGE